MSAQITSLFAFHKEVVPTLSERQAAVRVTLAAHGELTNSEIGDLLGWGINRVTPRVNELRVIGKVVCRNPHCPNPRHLNAPADIVHDDCKRTCRVTGRSAFAWRLVAQ